MRTVKIMVCEVKEVQIPDELYQDAQYDTTEWSDERWDKWQNGINKIGELLGYDLNPEEGCEWATPLCNLPEDAPVGGVIAIINEQNEIMAQA